MLAYHHKRKARQTSHKRDSSCNLRCRSRQQVLILPWSRSTLLEQCSLRSPPSNLARFCKNHRPFSHNCRVLVQSSVAIRFNKNCRRSSSHGESRFAMSRTRLCLCSCIRGDPMMARVLHFGRERSGCTKYNVFQRVLACPASRLEKHGPDDACG